MNPFYAVSRAEAEAQRRYVAYHLALAGRPLDLLALWEARRAWERAEQRQRQVRSRLDRWRRLRYEWLGPALPAVEAGKRRLTWRALDKALGDLDARAEGIGPWMLATQRLSLATRQAGDSWSFYVVAAIRQALQCPSDLQGELLRLPIEQLVRLVRTLSLYGDTLAQAERALLCWAEEQRLKREAERDPDLAA